MVHGAAEHPVLATGIRRAAVVHDVTAVDQRLSSGKRVSGEFTQRFTRPGTYA